MSAVGQRLIPIRPSPLRGHNGQNSNASSFKNSSSCLTPPQTGVKRKFEEYDDDEFDEYDGDSCKRKINFACDYVVSPPPVSISRRNARERNRVKQVNNGFAALRQHIPGAAKAKKISKVDTLKKALEYITNLQMLIDESDKVSIQHTNQPHHESSSYSMQNSTLQNYPNSSHIQSPTILDNSKNYFFNDSFTDQNSQHSNMSSSNCPSPSVPPNENSNISYSPMTNISQTPPHMQTSPPNLISPVSPSPVDSTASSKVMSDHRLNARYSYQNQPIYITSNNGSRNQMMVSPSSNNVKQYQPLCSVISTPPPVNQNPYDMEMYNQQQSFGGIQTLSPLQPVSSPNESISTVEPKLPVESAHYDHPNTVQNFPHLKNIRVKEEEGNYLQECASDITNIDSAITSNLTSSLATLIDDYQDLDSSAPLVDGTDNLLETLDFWEKC